MKALIQSCRSISDDAGGHVVAVGTPEDVAATRESYTGQYLKQVLKRRPSSKRPAATEAAE